MSSEQLITTPPTEELIRSLMISIQTGIGLAKIIDWATVEPMHRANALTMVRLLSKKIEQANEQ